MIEMKNHYLRTLTNSERLQITYMVDREAIGCQVVGQPSGHLQIRRGSITDKAQNEYVKTCRPSSNQNPLGNCDTGYKKKVQEQDCQR